MSQFSVYLKEDGPQSAEIVSADDEYAAAEILVERIWNDLRDPRDRIESGFSVVVCDESGDNPQIMSVSVDVTFFAHHT